MTTIAAGGPSARRKSTGRRAVLRWAFRLFLREWRQQVLVVLLLALAVAAATAFGIAGYTLAPAPGRAAFGSASHFIRLQPSEPATLDADVAAASQWFGTVEVISHHVATVPGRFELMDYRAQDPTGMFGAPMLALLDGRYPSALNEVAVTDEVAEDFGLAVGDTFALDGTPRHVVGLVENPNDLHDEFALLTPDDTSGRQTVTLLVDSTDQRVLDFRAPGGGGRSVGSRSETSEAIAVAVGVLGLTAIMLVFVALLAAAGFIVVAQRRRRQLGMLSAIGASDRHVRLALLGSGLALGVVASSIGAVVGLAAWLVAHDLLESAVGFRAERFDLPWWLIASIVLLGVGAATAASWWPARLIARSSIVGALSGRPERPLPARRSGIVAGSLVAVGVIALGGAGPVADERAVHWTDVGLVLGGTVATVLGVLLASPLAIRMIGSLARRVPIAPRIALRDLSRYQSRSAAALASIALATGISIAVVVAASAAQYTAESGNLAENQLLIRVTGFGGPFVPEAGQSAALDGSAAAIAAAVGGDAVVVALEVAVDPTMQDTGEGVLAASLARRTDDGWMDLSLLYLASPALLAQRGVGVVAIDPAVEILTSETPETGELGLLAIPPRPGTGHRWEPEPLGDYQHLDQTYSSLPGAFIVEDALARRGIVAMSAGQWLVVASDAFTDDQIHHVQELAADTGLTVESRDRQLGLFRLRSIATTAGTVLALAVLAMIVGLIRAEAAAGMRTLSAAGASNTVRRTITATTAGALAFAGVAVGAAGAVVVLAAGYVAIGDALTRVPLSQAGAMVVGMPAIAAIAGWSLGGREPPLVSRQPIT